MPARPLLLSLTAAIAVAVAGCGASLPRPLAGVGTLPPSASPWPAALHDARHTATATAVGPQHAGLRWTRRLEGPVVPGPVIGVDGSVIAASDGGVLHGLDPVTGHDRWTFDAHGRYNAGDISTSPAVLDDGTILWPGPHNCIYALDHNGRRLWTLQFPGQPLSPAVAGNRRAYISDETGELSALDVRRTTQKRLIWRIRLDRISDSSAAVAPNGLIYVTGRRQLFAVSDRGSRAHVQWRFRSRDDIEVSPAATGSSVAILGTNNDQEYGVGPDGKAVWAFAKNSFTFSSAAATATGLAVFGDHRGRLDFLDPNGHLLRADQTVPPGGEAHPAGIGVWTAPALDARGDAYFGTAAGHVYGFSASGAQLWDLRTGAIVDSYPALDATGALYVGAQNGLLYAIGDALSH